MCVHRCGNSALDPFGVYTEECDDGNLVSGDGCSASCNYEDDYECSRVDNSASNPDICTLRCGNGVLDSNGSYNEECDDSNVISGDGCSATCTAEDDYTCSGNYNP